MSASFRRLQYAAAVLFLFATPVPTVDAQALPPAQELIARYVKEIGGESWKSHTSAKMVARLEVPAAGMSASIEAFSIYPKQYFMTMDIPGLGSIQTGYNGTVAWMKDPMTGPRLLQGAEADQVSEEAEPEAALRTSSRIVSSETTGKANMNGEECYQVRHTWKSGRITTDCFSAASGLLVATTSMQANQMGDIEVTTLYSDYKDFGGLKRASVTKAQMMGAEATTTIISMEWDKVKPADIELPDDIKALLKKGQ